MTNSSKYKTVHCTLYSIDENASSYFPHKNGTLLRYTLLENGTLLRNTLLKNGTLLRNTLSLNLTDDAIA